MVASATHAPSRISPSESMAGYQPSARLRVSTASQTRASTGNPKENPTPRSRQAAAKRWVAPAVSERTTTAGAPGSPGRHPAGSAANAWSSTLMWSAAVFEPALPLRSSPASASPPAISGRSRNANKG